MFPEPRFAFPWLFHSHQFALLTSSPFHTASVAPLGFRLHCGWRLSAYECSGASFPLSLEIIVQYSGKKRVFELDIWLGIPALPLTTVWYWGYYLTSGPPFLVCSLEWKQLPCGAAVRIKSDDNGECWEGSRYLFFLFLSWASLSPCSLARGPFKEADGNKAQHKASSLCFLAFVFSVPSLDHPLSLPSLDTFAGWLHVFPWL